MHYPTTPPLRLSSVNLLTDLGWFAGTLHVPGRQSLADFLAPGNYIVKLTRVRIPNETERLPFVAVRRESIILVEPTQGDELVDTPGSIGRTSSHRVGCVLPVGTLHGSLEVLVNVRVSDFLRQQPGLQPGAQAPGRPRQPRPGHRNRGVGEPAGLIGSPWHCTGVCGTSTRTGFE